MAAYSFVSVQCTITGPGGSFTLGSGAGASEEGIKISRNREKTVQTVGADGKVMYSLIADRTGSVEVHLLKTSDQNSKLMAMYNTQQLSAALWGTNLITLAYPDGGDTSILSEVAFKKAPDLTYAQEGGTNTWEFFAGTVDSNLGTY